MSLHARMAKGVMWSLLEKGGQQAISFLVFMVIARLVGPEEYGLANICFVFFAVANLIVLSIVDGVVNLQIEDDERLSTLFWAVLGIGVALALVSLAAAEPMALALHEPRLRSLLALFSVIPILLALASVPTIMLLKELDFRVYAVRSILAATIGGAVGIFAAFQGYGAFALIFQQIALFAVNNLVVWTSVRWRPRRVFSRARLGETIRPGLKLAGSMLINVSEREVPRILIMIFMGPLALGYYAFVARVRYAIQDIFVNPPFAVLYPSLAKLNDDPVGQKRLLGVFITAAGVAIFPILACAAVAAPLYMPILFGNKWDESIPLLQVFIVCGGILPLQFVVREMLRARNRMQRFLKLQGVYVAAVLVVTIAVLPLGLVEVALGTLAVGLLFVPVFYAALEKWEGVALWHELAKLWAPIAASALMAAAIYGYADGPYAADDPWLRLILALAAGGVAYLAATGVLLRGEIRRVCGYLKRRRTGEAA